jgi:hypothetical protein
MASSSQAHISLALHYAVWDDNIERLAALLNTPRGRAQLETVDARGDTPLLLAYRMGRFRAARALIAAGAFPKARARGGWEAIQVAALSGSPELVRESVLAFLAETDAAFARRLPGLQDALESMPDFSIMMKWEFNSWVPLVSSLLPSDTYSIFKRGSSLRLDTTLLGMSGLRWERGSVSMIVGGRGTRVPGSVRVLDNEARTACDARLAFTRPQDVHIQDWVRKLLTQRQKVTDWWSRDTRLVPILRAGLFGGLARGAGRLLGLGSEPRGRLSAGADAGAGDDSDGVAAAPPQHVYNSNQVVEDVGGWTDCVAYEMRNLCIVDFSRAPVRASLELADWWRPDFSRQVDDAEAAESVANDEARAASSADVVATAEAPEKLLKPLQMALAAVRLGKINQGNAANTTLADLEKMGFGDADLGVFAGANVSAIAFSDYFGVDRRALTAEAEAASSAAASTDVDESGDPLPPETRDTDGLLHRATGAVAGEATSSSVKEDEKILDPKVHFCKAFPLTVAQFLPVADMMARTSRHAENFRAFFNSKMPAGAGFPVRFTVPVFPTVTATVTFELADTRRSPPASIFDVPADYKMGAYVERGFIRQL